MVDTCCDPTPIDYVIPANDDAAKSIECILGALCDAIQEGLNERKLERDKEAAEQPAEEKTSGKKLRARKSAKPVDVEAEAAAEPVKEDAPKAEPAKEVAPKAEPVKEEAPKAEEPKAE